MKNLTEATTKFELFVALQLATDEELCAYEDAKLYNYNARAMVFDEVEKRYRYYTDLRIKAERLGVKTLSAYYDEMQRTFLHKKSCLKTFFC